MSVPQHDIWRCKGLGKKNCFLFPAVYSSRNESSCKSCSAVEQILRNFMLVCSFPRSDVLLFTICSAGIHQSYSLKCMIYIPFHTLFSFLHNNQDWVHLVSQQKPLSSRYWSIMIIYLFPVVIILILTRKCFTEST